MDIDIQTTLGLAFDAFAKQDYANAEAHFRAVRSAGFTGPELLHHLGFLARNRGDHDEAADLYADALETAPADPQILTNLGEARHAQGRFGEAIALYRRARALAPDQAPIAANLGKALLAAKRPDLAIRELQAALALDPKMLSAAGDYAICVCSLGRYAEAVPIYQDAYRQRPSNNDARYLEALALLALGDLENGWRRHEVRWYANLGQAHRHRLLTPYWSGEDDLTGKTILVHAEQGYGDTIMYLRYLPRLQAMAKRVILEVHTPLKGLLAGIPDVYGRGEELPAHDLNCSFMSLPFCFRTTASTIPADVPYLTTPPDALAAWRERLGPADGRRRIGVAWTGSSAVWNRSIPLEQFVPLLRRQDCVFHLVQTTMEPGDREIMATLPDLVDLSEQLTSFADTAAVTALMDLTITVDTALCHLAGALAKPVWTMLPFGAEYRWRNSGETSPWYPTMRLFRQPALNDWPAVITALQTALTAVAPAPESPSLSPSVSPSVPPSASPSVSASVSPSSPASASPSAPPPVTPPVAPPVSPSVAPSVAASAPASAPSGAPSPPTP